MKPEIAFPHEKLSPILDNDEFLTPAWQIEALEARLLAPNVRGLGARLYDSFEAFDD